MLAHLSLLGCCVVGQLGPLSAGKATLEKPQTACQSPSGPRTPPWPPRLASSVLSLRHWCSLRRTVQAEGPSSGPLRLWLTVLLRGRSSWRACLPSWQSPPPCGVPWVLEWGLRGVWSLLSCGCRPSPGLAGARGARGQEASRQGASVQTARGKQRGARGQGRATLSPCQLSADSLTARGKGQASKPASPKGQASKEQGASQQGANQRTQTPPPQDLARDPRGPKREASVPTGCLPSCYHTPLHNFNAFCKHASCLHISLPLSNSNIIFCSGGPTLIFTPSFYLRVA